MLTVRTVCCPVLSASTEASPAWEPAACILVLLAAVRALTCAAPALPAAAPPRPLRPLVPHLLAMRDAITNWDAFSASNSIAGWDDLTPLCSWTGIACLADGTYSL